MTASRSKIDRDGPIETSPLPAVAATISVAVLHRSRQDRTRLVTAISAGDDLDVVIEGDRVEVDELRRLVPDVAVVEAALLTDEVQSVFGVDLPAVAVIAVADEDSPALGTAVLAGAVSSTLSSDTENIASIVEFAHLRLAWLTRRSANTVLDRAETGADLPEAEHEILRDLVAGHTVESKAQDDRCEPAEVAATLTSALVRTRSSTTP